MHWNLRWHAIDHARLVAAVDAGASLVRLGALLVIAAAGCGRIDFDTPAPAYVVSADANGVSTLFRLDVSTGRMTPLVAIPDYGKLDGLATWDRDTLYATSAMKTVVEIKLSSLTWTSVGQVGADLFALDAGDGLLEGVADSGQLYSFAPGGTATVTTITDPTGTAFGDPNGGDLARLSDGRWFWFASGPGQLYALDVATAIATPLGAPLGFQASGMFRDDHDRLFVISPNEQAMIEVSLTGDAVRTIPLCVECPVPYALGTGDAAGAP